VVVVVVEEEEEDKQNTEEHFISRKAYKIHKIIEIILVQFLFLWNNNVS
jgi:hypothetical protein